MMDLDQVSIFRHIDPNSSYDVHKYRQTIQCYSLHSTGEPSAYSSSYVDRLFDPLQHKGRLVVGNSDSELERCLGHSQFVEEWPVGGLTKLSISFSSALNSPRLLKVA